MANIRRSARELALKALFQFEVGKQPLPEVLEGALDQVRITVRNPIAHVLMGAQAEIKTVVAQHAAEMPAPSARRLRTAGRACSRLLIVLVDALADGTEGSVSTGVPRAAAAALDAARVALADAQAGLARVGARETLHPRPLADVTAAADRGARALVKIFGRHLPQAVEVGAFARSLVEGVVAHRPELDVVIAATATGWRLNRLAAVDRNILRLGAYELLYAPDVPPAAVINEAVELAKKYSTGESGRFVNGVLGALPRRPAPTADPEEEA